MSSNNQSQEEKEIGGLELAPSPERRVTEAPQPFNEFPKYTVESSCRLAPQVVNAEEKELSHSASASNGEKRICGCTPQLFPFLAGILALIIVGAAVGGGVGGSFAAKQDGVSTVTVTMTASTSSSTAPSSTTSATPKSPFYFTIYSDPNFTGESQNFSTAGNYSLPWRASSYVWNQQDSGCCALFCRSGADVGYRCSEVTHQPNVTGGGAERVAVQCGAGNDTAPPGAWCVG